MCLVEVASCQKQTQRTLLDWLRMEYAIEKPSNKLLAVTELDSDTWVGRLGCRSGCEEMLLSPSPSLPRRRRGE
jgi:hypothetical protein